MLITHNRFIYHCLSCGAILHGEPEQEVPSCCGRPMINAAAQTVYPGREERCTDCRSGAQGDSSATRCRNGCEIHRG